MEAGAGQFTLDGNELALVALADEVKVTVRKNRKRFAFRLACHRHDCHDVERLDTIDSPYMFRSHGEAIGYGRATLESAERVIAQQKASNDDIG